MFYGGRARAGVSTTSRPVWRGQPKVRGPLGWEEAGFGWGCFLPSFCGPEQAVSVWWAVDIPVWSTKPTPQVALQRAGILNLDSQEACC